MGSQMSQVSISTVGRILTHLKKTKQIVDPISPYKQRRKSSAKRPWARRKTFDYIPKFPGALVQIDTVQEEIVPGLIRRQFTARDVISKFDAIKAYSRATSRSAKYFLDHLCASFPFEIKAIQIDGGSEFKGEFEKECAARNLPLYVLPPRSPKLNGCVERANRTHDEEFYQLRDIPIDIGKHNQLLLHWQNTYNFIRPHRSLGLLTPAQFVAQYFNREVYVSDMY